MGNIALFKKFIGNDKPRTPSNLVALEKLGEMLELLEKKQKICLKKADAELEKAREFSPAKNKKAAIQCLRKKKLHEQQAEKFQNFHIRIYEQMIMLESAQATGETLEALKSGAASMEAIQKAMNIDDVDKTMEEINEQTESMKMIQDALSTPFEVAADFDEDELEAELENLDEELLSLATTMPTAHVLLSSTRQVAQPPKNKIDDEELAALQAELAN